MSYTTPPIANRLGYNRGWMFQLVPQNTNLPNVTSLVYLKSYFILKEYLRFYQINLLSFYIQPLTPTINLIHLMVYKHIRYPRKKSHPVFIDRLNKQGYFKVFNVFQHARAIKSISMVGSKNTWQNTALQQSKLNSYDKLHSMTRKFEPARNKTLLRSRKQSIKCKPTAFLNFMNANVQKLVKSKRKQDLIFIRQLRHSDISLHHFCTIVQNMQLHELILCMKKALNNQEEKIFKRELLTSLSQSNTYANVRNKIDKKVIQKNLKFLAKAGKKKSLSLSKLKVLLKSNIATRIRLAKKIMIYWKYINSYRNQFYLTYHNMKLRSFLRQRLSENNNITDRMFSKSEEILKNYDIAKRLVFSLLGLYANKIKSNRKYKYMYIYNNVLRHQNKLNKNLSWLTEIKIVKRVHKNIVSLNEPAQISNSVQNLMLKKNIKIKKELYKPVLNNKVRLNYLFESYLQNICQISSVVKVIPTSSNVWLKKTYNNFKSKPRLKRAAEGRFFKRLLFAFTNAERYMTPQLIADLIANELTIPRKHKPLLRNINALFDAVHSRYILGYKIVVDGKLNGVMKSTKQIIKFKGKDKMPVQEFHKRVLYALGVSRTYTGLFGVRVWLYY